MKIELIFAESAEEAESSAPTAKVILPLLDKYLYLGMDHDAFDAYGCDPVEYNPNNGLPDDIKHEISNGVSYHREVAVRQTGSTKDTYQVIEDKLGVADSAAFGISDDHIKTLKEVASPVEIDYLLSNDMIMEKHITEAPVDYKFDGAHNLLFSDGLIVAINPQVVPYAGFDGEFADWENI